MATAEPAQRRTPKPRDAAVASRLSPFLFGWFRWYVRRYLPKHFHAVGLSGPTPRSMSPDEPLIVYVNHASWWDPLVGIVVAEHVFPERRMFAPFDAAALAKYPLFERLGFFPVRQDSLRGAGEFLRTARAILDQPNSSIWITPEGKFVDPRDQSAAFQPGLAHLVEKLDRGLVLPMAIEYPFWEERLPEVLIRLGEPIDMRQHEKIDKGRWQTELESALRRTQEELQRDSVERRTEAFTLLLRGATGVSATYDLFRRWRARFSGGRWDKQHGTKW